MYVDCLAAPPTAGQHSANVTVIDVSYPSPRPPRCSKDGAVMGARRRLAKRDRTGAALHDYVE
jgi:hypothetical protein